MIDQLGAVPLFVGVESEHWALSDFIVVARDAKALGISCLLIKIADGGNLWYDAVGGWQAVLSAISQQGMRAVPYTYCYGNQFGAIQAEVNILIQAMHVCGIVIADMEAEFNGQTSWASAICTALKPVAGTFGVTSWANPDEQNWTGVLQSLAPCVDFWMPQVYTDYLAGRYQAQYSAYGLPVYPALDLAPDVGPNNVLANARNANSPIIALWEYQGIGGSPDIVKQIVALSQEVQIMLQISQVADFFVETVPNQRWHCLQTQNDVSYGILNFYRTFGQVGLNGLSIYGLPRTGEIRVPGTKQATFQVFERGAILYDPSGEVDKVPGLAGPCYPAHIDKGPVYQVLVGPSKPANLSQVQQALSAISALAEQLKADGETLASTAQTAQKALGQ